MWKPGTEKPKQKADAKSKSKTPKTPKRSSKKSADQHELISSPELTSRITKEPTSSAKKRLTGSTMNMRFMKRKKETDEYENMRKQQQEENTVAQHQKNEQESASMDMDVDGEGQPMRFQEATPTDMYGMQSSLTGRRSFGRFNPAVEEAWKTSKKVITAQSGSRPAKSSSSKSPASRNRYDIS